MKGFIVSAAHSGAGKTTLTLALMQALRARGVAFSPYKAGPDFIDPMWHRAVAGKTSYNLEPSMMPMAHIQQLFDRRDGMPVIEGVGGLFCGGSNSNTANLAMKLSIPVVFVVDAAGMAGSIAPLVAGFSGFHAEVHIAGVIANRVGSTGHALMLKEALAANGLPPLLGWLENDDACLLPERHLGLHLPHEEDVPDFSSALHLEDTFRALLQSASQADCRQPSGRKAEQGALLRNKRIAIARDDAFCFIYPANLEWIIAQGGLPDFFSPLAGECVPEGADALWLPGGYPELHAEALSGRGFYSIRMFIESNKPVLAECGGMMILGETLVSTEGEHWPMAGLLPFNVVMQKRLVSLGYRRSVSDSDSPLCGHEFHYSVREMHEDIPAAFDVEQGDAGVSYRQLRASYCHWYFPSSPETAARLFGAAI
ncbi:MAG: cobyrinate a,c-diamide synthase [Mariprofundus sp.]|nr:cobyrinate a,c-diamide synthase [Mariprofundus sp.]